MNTKEKQKEIIKSYLKPKLKEEGFRTSGQTWWKIIDDFFILISLQNSQWNSKNELNFCFNIGIGLTKKMRDPNKKKATHYDLAIPWRENGYLSKNRQNHKYRKDSSLGYKLSNKTDLVDFTNELKTDFEVDILPKLNGLKTIDDCMEFYGKSEVWRKVLKKQIDELRNTN